jgi:UDP-N-acetylmuramoyl-tripeptide--D-alanyl-D-alanine ligase
MNLTFDYIVQSLGGKLLQASDTNITSVSIDSRTLKPGALFFALSGDNSDGHDYIPNAIKKGAAAVVLSRPVPELDSRTGAVMVPDTLTALQDLAANYRKQFNLPVAAVTGSVGKTTTKDILAQCLGQGQSVLKTMGNYNNEIGLPLTILGLEPEHRAAVVELAMRASGEIRRLALIAQPTCAIITNVEPVHLETMGSLEKIALAKCEVLEQMDQSNFALINGDNHLLVKTASKFSCRQYTFGTNRDFDIEIAGVESLDTGLNIDIRLFEVRDKFFFPVPAPELAVNVAAAAGTAYILGKSVTEIKEGIKHFQCSSNRLHIINLPEGGKVINDTYNANPVSVAAALQLASKLKKKARTVAVLGDMLELGPYEVPGHMKVGKEAAELGIDILVTLGQRSAHIASAAVEAGMAKDAVKHF